MTSVERIQTYTRLPQEADEHTDVQLPPRWPANGEICMKQMTLKYPLTGEPALKDISFRIHGKEKVDNASFNVRVKYVLRMVRTVYPKKYAHGFCFAVLFCGYTLTDLPISIRLTSLALWQSNDCPSASKATLMNMDKYFMWIHYERLHNHNKAKHNKTVCIFLGIYCMSNCMVCINWYWCYKENSSCVDT